MLNLKKQPSPLKIPHPVPKVSALQDPFHLHLPYCCFDMLCSDGACTDDSCMCLGTGTVVADDQKMMDDDGWMKDAQRLFFLPGS